MFVKLFTFKKDPSFDFVRFHDLGIAKVHTHVCSCGLKWLIIVTPFWDSSVGVFKTIGQGILSFSC